MVQIWETVFSVPVPVPVPDFRVRSKKCVTLNLPFLNRPQKKKLEGPFSALDLVYNSPISL